MIVGIDPGDTTGVFIFYPDNKNKLHRVIHHELDQIQFMQMLYAWNGAFNSKRINFIVEDFIITAQTGKKTRQPYSLENIGMMKYMTEMHPSWSLHLQTPSERKFSTDTKLKAIDWWSDKGKGHSNDAARHVLKWMWQEDLLDYDKKEQIKRAI